MLEYRCIKMYTKIVAHSIRCFLRLQYLNYLFFTSVDQLTSLYFTASPLAYNMDSAEGCS